MKITANDFLAAFKETWELVVDTEEVKQKYSSNKAWTEFMNGNPKEKSFLYSVFSHFSSKGSYTQEWYTIDGLFMNDKDVTNGEVLPKGKFTPSGFYCLVEHENGQDIEIEMWKLLFWRCPLKIIIFYDWNEYEKTSEKRKVWLSEKLNSLKPMFSNANNFFEENSDTEYLLLWANKEKCDSHPQWRYLKLDSQGIEKDGVKPLNEFQHCVTCI